MKLFTFTRLAVLAAGAAVAAGAFVACSNSDANPAPPVPVFDSGIPNNPDAYVPPPVGDSSPPPQPEASLVDTNLPDVGSCVSDASTCNSCYSPAQDPLNGCSPATVNCIPFDNTRVPTGAP